MSATIILHPTLACDLKNADLIGQAHHLAIHIVRGRLVFREKSNASTAQNRSVAHQSRNRLLKEAWSDPHIL